MILILDSNSIFIRHYCANPAMDNNGLLSGGVVGFLSTLSYLVRQYKPEKIYAVWESGGSIKRTSLYPQYKGNRDRVSYKRKNNRFYEELIPDSEENEKRQRAIIIKLLKTLPVCQLYVANCEADDVIGYVCRNTFSNDNKMIVSTDKDFYQLLNKNTSIYSPSKKITITEQDVLNEFSILASNFCLAKSLCGDKSDNIEGIERVGFQTLAKKFPILAEQKITIPELYEINNQYLSDKKKAKQKIFNNINDGRDIVERNWKLMYLDTIMISSDQIQKINQQISDYVPKKSRFAFYKAQTKYELNTVINSEQVLSAFDYFQDNL